MKQKKKLPVSSVVSTIETVGDRWIIFIIREAFFGNKTFEQFQANLGIATNILSARLKKLVLNGIFERLKNKDDGRRFIYKLTPKGFELYPIILALMNWGDRWLAGKEGPPLLLYHKNCGHRLEPVMCCAHCRKPVHAREVTYEEKVKRTIEVDIQKKKKRK
jgi:DNA-binding HxlR family transcriptional regulator